MSLFLPKFELRESILELELKGHVYFRESRPRHTYDVPQKKTMCKERIKIRNKGRKRVRKRKEEAA